MFDVKDYLIPEEATEGLFSRKSKELSEEQLKTLDNLRRQMITIAQETFRKPEYKNVALAFKVVNGSLDSSMYRTDKRRYYTIYTYDLTKLGKDQFVVKAGITSGGPALAAMSREIIDKCKALITNYKWVHIDDLYKSDMKSGVGLWVKA